LSFSGPGTNVFQQYGQLLKDNIVEDHRTRNKSNKPPSVEELVAQASNQAKRTRSESEQEDADNDDDTLPKAKRAKRNSLVSTRHAPKRHHLRFYKADKEWHLVAVHSKRRMRLLLSVDNAFIDRCDNNLVRELAHKVKEGFEKKNMRFTDSMSTLTLLETETDAISDHQIDHSFVTMVRAI